MKFTPLLTLSLALHISCVTINAFFQNASPNNPIKALVISPIVDLITPSLKSQFPHQSARRSYNSLPISWGLNSSDIAMCPGLHQALFNKTVEVIGQTN